MNRESIGKAIFAIGIALTLILAIVLATAPEPPNCTRTGATRSVASSIILGTTVIPYTYQQPIYKCSAREGASD